MKVGDPGLNRASTPILRRIGGLGLLLGVFALGLIAGSTNWYTELLSTLRGTATRIGSLRTQQQIPAMLLDIAFEDYNHLLAQREAALNDGVHMSSEAGYVPAEIRLGSEAITVQIQLREGPSDNLGVTDKWPFDIRVTQGALLTAVPFDRFYLEDPAENNWLAQWAFTEALQKEGLPAARYRFVRLILNGSDQGLYAVQEGYGNSVLAAQQQFPGIIIGYDTDPLLEAIVHFGGSSSAALTDPVSNLSHQDFRSLNIEVSPPSSATDNPELKTQIGQAVSLLYALQTGNRPPSEVFDPAAYGRFLALVDLWGATDATSLLNLRYIYDSDSGILQPLSINADPLRAGERLSFAATYGDPILQMAYVQEALHLTEPAYIEELQDDLSQSYGHLSLAMGGELPGGASLWQQLADRQEKLRQSLHPIHPVLATVLFDTGPDYGLLQIDVANRLNLPVEILGFDIDGATFVDASPQQLAANAAETIPDMGNGVVLRPAGSDGSDYLRYTRFKLPLDTIHQLDREASFDQAMDLNVAVRVLGATDTQLVPAIAEVSTATEPAESP